MRFQVIKNIIQKTCLHRLLCQSVLYMWGSFTSNNWTCWWHWIKGHKIATVIRVHLQGEGLGGIQFLIPINLPRISELELNHCFCKSSLT